MTSSEKETFYEIVREFNNFQVTLKNYEDKLKSPAATSSYHKACKKYAELYDRLFIFYLGKDKEMKVVYDEIMEWVKK